MLIKHYAAFVSRTDQFSERVPHEAKKIATLGLTSEIGSIVSAIKKETLREGGAISSPLAKAELVEELGDAMWYAFALARIQDGGNSEDILLSDIRKLKLEIGQNDERGARIRKVLTEPEVTAFFEGAEAFENHPRRQLSDYQKLAFKTARTNDGLLLTVCASILTQLGAQLMWHLLPDIEKELNPESIGRPINIILSEIAWHLCAIASLYSLDIDDIAQANFEKSNARHKSEKSTALYDSNFPKEEQLPRRFEVEFKSLSADTSQMYWNGKELGHPLKDQYYEGDGYRFHDVMHLANAAVLGWSPVLRDLMKIKRVSCPATKQSEDGGRSAVVEELVIKYIHVEASRRAKEFQGEVSAEDRVLFPEDREIPFSMIKKVRELTIGHEVYANKYWEWEQAIREGYRVFQYLRMHKQGKIIVDLNERKLSFKN